MNNRRYLLLSGLVLSILTSANTFDRVLSEDLFILLKENVLEVELQISNEYTDGNSKMNYIKQNIYSIISSKLNETEIKELMIFGSEEDSIFKLKNNFFNSLTNIESILALCPLKIVPNLFDPLKKTLKKLKLTIYNHHAMRIGFKNLELLKELTIFETPLTNIKPGTTINLPKNIEKLEFKSCYIQSIKRNSFLSLINLQILILRHNQLQKIDEGTFAGLGNLVELDLSSNYFFIIETNMFEGLTKLKTINLSSNHIMFIDQDVFLSTNIEILLLEYNLFKKIEKGMFDGLENSLKILNLQRNQINEIENNTFENFHKLELLVLNNNRIKDLKYNSTSDELNLWKKKQGISNLTQIEIFKLISGKKY